MLYVLFIRHLVICLVYPLNKCLSVFRCGSWRQVLVLVLIKFALGFVFIEICQNYCLCLPCFLSLHNFNNVLLSKFAVIFIFVHELQKFWRLLIKRKSDGYYLDIIFFVLLLWFIVSYHPYCVRNIKICLLNRTILL